MAVVGVVGEAVVLLLGVVEHQPEPHALARLLAVAEAAHAGQDRDDARVRIGQQRLARGGAFEPLRRYPVEIVDEQIGRRIEIGRTAVAIAPVQASPAA